MSNFYDRWENVISNIDLGSREPVWQKAIDIMIEEGDLEPTMSRELSQDWIQEIIIEKSTEPACSSIVGVVSEFSRWFIGVRIDSLPDYVVSGKELWLLYLMLLYYNMAWSGNEWTELEQGDNSEQEQSCKTNE